MNLSIAPNRTWYLMRHDLATHRRSLTVTAATIAGITIGLYLIASIFEPDGEFHGLFEGFLFIGGFIASSTMFSDFQDPKRGMSYLMLPGSALEKFLARLLLSSIGWTLGVIIVYSVATLVGAGIASIYSSTQPGVFLPLSRGVWQGIAGYLVVQSVFLFGSVYFRKGSFLKVVLSMVVSGIVVAAVAALTARIAFGLELLEYMFDAESIADVVVTQGGMSLGELATTRLVPLLTTINRIAVYAIVPIFFWIASVIRLSETEV